MTRFRGLAALPLVLLLSLWTVPARADDAARLALAKELMAQIHASDTMRQLLPLMAAQVRDTLQQRGQLDAEVDVFVSRYKERLSAEIGRYTDALAKAYADRFTEDELNGLLAFDRTPLGQKLIAATPELAQASMLAGHKLGQDVAQEVIDEMTAKKDKDANQRKL